MPSVAETSEAGLPVNINVQGTLLKYFYKGPPGAVVSVRPCDCAHWLPNALKWSDGSQLAPSTPLAPPPKVRGKGGSSAVGVVNACIGEEGEEEGPFLGCGDCDGVDDDDREFENGEEVVTRKRRLEEVALDVGWTSEDEAALAFDQPRLSMSERRRLVGRLIQVHAPIVAGKGGLGNNGDGGDAPPPDWWWYGARLHSHYLSADLDPPSDAGDTCDTNGVNSVGDQEDARKVRASSNSGGVGGVEDCFEAWPVRELRGAAVSSLAASGSANQEQECARKKSRARGSQANTVVTGGLKGSHVLSFMPLNQLFVVVEADGTKQRYHEEVVEEEVVEEEPLFDQVEAATALLPSGERERRRPSRRSIPPRHLPRGSVFPDAGMKHSLQPAPKAQLQPLTLEVRRRCPLEVLAACAAPFCGPAVNAAAVARLWEASSGEALPGSQKLSAVLTSKLLNSCHSAFRRNPVALAERKTIAAAAVGTSKKADNRNTKRSFSSDVP